MVSDDRRSSKKVSASEIVKTRTEYDAEGRVVYEGYPFSGSADRGTRIEYDPLSRVTRRINPSVDPNNPPFSTLTYSPGSVVITDENGHQATQTWDTFGDPDDARLLSVLDADNKLWAYEYHVLGELAKVTAVGGVTRTWVYNDQHLLSSETHPESGTTTYGYDSEGRLTQKTDANTTTTTYTYDADNRIQTITAGSRVTTIGYETNSENRASASATAVGSTFLYDNAGRLRLRQDAIDGKLFDSKYEYDADDNLRAIVYPSGRRIEYDYDGEHQITRVFETAAGRDYAIGMTYQASGALATI
jgi:YD repeat-containing protein